uniref:PseudoU_synth_2 domain-containing protein n=1 Tax=Mesocestoides corti TaxID=53468 RepID=A0A5K3EG82_MESCO
MCFKYTPGKDDQQQNWLNMLLEGRRHDFRILMRIENWNFPPMKKTPPGYLKFAMAHHKLCKVDVVFREEHTHLLEVFGRRLRGKRTYGGRCADQSLVCHLIFCVVTDSAHVLRKPV